MPIIHTMKRTNSLLLTLLLLVALLPALALAQPFVRHSFSPSFSSNFNDRFGAQLVCHDTNQTIVSSPNRMVDMATPGTVEVIDLSTNTILETFVSDAQQSQDQFGEEVISIPDIDGNQIRDIMIGAPGEDSLGNVYVFSDTGARIAKFTANSLGTSTNNRFGATIAYIGHIDRGEGFGPIAYFAIAATQYDSDINMGFLPDGAVEIWSIGGSSLTPVYRDTIFGEPEDSFGRAIAVLNDVDKDGFNEIAIGATTRGDVGAVHIYEFDGLSGEFELLRTLNGATPDRAYGEVLTALSDIDGDTLDDLFVGAPERSESGVGGEFFVYSGSTFLSSGAAVVERCNFEELMNDSFPSAAVGTQDLTEDGRADFAVGDPRSGMGGEIKLYSFNSGTCQQYDQVVNPGFETDFGYELAYGKCDYENTGRPDLLGAVSGASTDQVEILMENSTRANTIPEIPNSSDLTFRVNRQATFSLSNTYDSDPLNRCTRILYARTVTGEETSLPQVINIRGVDEIEDIDSVQRMPLVARVNGNRPIINLIAVTQCGDEGVFRSNVFARFMNCGICSTGVTPEEWIEYLQDALGGDRITRKRALKKRRKINRKQRRQLKKCRYQRRHR